MPKIRHIALSSKDPETTAAFYKQAFEFEEVGRANSKLAEGIYLSDGTINLAILRFKTDQLGRGMDYVGLHHFGVLVDDVDRWTEHLEALGAECFVRRPEAQGTANFEVKFHGPEGVNFDIAEHPWAGALPVSTAAAE